MVTIERYFSVYDRDDLPPSPAALYSSHVIETDTQFIEKMAWPSPAEVEKRPIAELIAAVSQPRTRSALLPLIVPPSVENTDGGKNVDVESYARLIGREFCTKYGVYVGILHTPLMTEVSSLTEVEKFDRKHGDGALLLAIGGSEDQQRLPDVYERLGSLCTPVVLLMENPGADSALAASARLPEAVGAVA